MIMYRNVRDANNGILAALGRSKSMAGRKSTIEKLGLADVVADLSAQGQSVRAISSAVSGLSESVVSFQTVQRYLKSDAGKSKVVAAREKLASVRPELPADDLFMSALRGFVSSMSEVAANEGYEPRQRVAAAEKGGELAIIGLDLERLRADR